MLFFSRSGPLFSQQERRFLRKYIRPTCQCVAWSVTIRILKCKDQGVTKRCRLSWLTNSVLVYEPKSGGVGGLQGLCQWVQLCTWSPNKLWRCNFIFNLLCHGKTTSFLRSCSLSSPLSGSGTGGALGSFCWFTFVKIPANMTMRFLQIFTFDYNEFYFFDKTKPPRQETDVKWDSRTHL